LNGQFNELKELKMKRLVDFAQRLWKDEEGATMVEYGIMVALIAAVSIGIVMALGTYTGGAFTAVNTSLAGAPITPIQTP
jgi:pilus assembly protein Flp/PilA